MVLYSQRLVFRYCNINLYSVKFRWYNYSCIMIILISEWWLVPTTADHCGHIPATELKVKFLFNNNASIINGKLVSARLLTYSPWNLHDIIIKEFSYPNIIGCRWSFMYTGAWVVHECSFYGLYPWKLQIPRGCESDMGRMNCMRRWRIHSNNIVSLLHGIAFDCPLCSAELKVFFSFFS